VLGGPNAGAIAAKCGPRVTAFESLEQFESFLKARRQAAQK